MIQIHAAARLTGLQRDSIRSQLERARRDSRARRVRTIRQFAEQEIIIPSGQYQGLRFSCRRQPFAALWFDLIDETRSASIYPERVITGPSQSGKTLVGFVIPILYHLFELGERVIAAVPNGDMVKDKWEADIEPVLARTRYRDLAPRGGKGSSGGATTAITFRNGAILRFMTAGGSDKSRAAFTSRVICMTETDGFDERTSTSDEADKIEQIEARVRSYPAHRQRIYKECTVTTEDGHTWRRYKAGTASRIMLPCPHCAAWVAPGRENLQGWREAKTDAEAVREAQFHCPACGEAWSEPERVAANHQAKILHGEQTIDSDGAIHGDPPDTLTLGFRWSAVNNLLVPAGDVGRDEWRATRAVDEDNEERKLCQFVWAVPYEPLAEDKIRITTEGLQRRQNGLGKGVLPHDTELVTVGVDVNQTVMHWTAIAWDAADPRRGYVIDYGQQPISQERIFALAIADSLQELQERLGTGWSVVRVDRIGVDCRAWTDIVVRAVKERRDPAWRCFMGLGKGHWAKYKPVPNKHSRETIWIGDQAYERVVPKHACVMLYADANYWKTWLHSRLVIDVSRAGELPPGAITLYATAERDPHHKFSRQLTAEIEVEKFEKGKGYHKVWEAIRQDNHYLDSTYIACVLANRYARRPVSSSAEAYASAEEVVQQQAQEGSQFARTTFDMNHSQFARE